MPAGEIKRSLTVFPATPEPRETLCVGLRETNVTGDLREAKDEFARLRAVSCRHLLDDALLDHVQRLSDTGGWVPETVDPGHREAESPQRAGRLLNLALSRPAMLRWLEEVTGCGRLRAIEGRVSQTRARPEDRLDWHDDRVDPARRLAVVIALGQQPYGGGEFEMRRKGADVAMRFRHTEPGSALIFAVAPELEHRVLPVTSGGPRRVFAGWALAGSAAL